MASNGPIGTPAANVASHRKRHPRKLNFLSCTFCRSAKVKCLPVYRTQAEEKCLRCRHKNLACSAPQRKASYNQGQSKGSSLVSRTVTPDIDFDLQAREGLVILSLLHILGLAYTELEAIGKGILKPLEGDRAYRGHRNELDDILDSYCSLLEGLRDKLKDTPSTVAHIILAATVDVAYPPHFLNHTKALEDQEHKISHWEGKSHHGIAYILHIRRLQYKRDPTDNDVQKMIRARNNLIDSIGDVIERQNMTEELLLDLTETQLFVPKDLFQIPAIAKAIEQDGRRDCLFRPVGHIFHDNKVDAKLRLNSHDDGYDVLDRSRLHITCALGANEQYLPDLISLSRFERPHATMLGLDAFHIAATHGNTYMFRAAAASGLNVFSYLHCFHASDYTRRNYIHWAACLGHLELVEYLLKLCERNLIRSLLAFRDQWDDTAMHLAARNGHTDIVEAILPHVDWHQMRTRLRHTPFWAATTGCHLDIMKLLAPFCNVDEDELGGLTPLAEASRQGFYEGVRYLLTLSSVTLNSINSKGGMLKTPLDLALEGGHTKCVEILKEHGALTRQDLGLMG